MTRLSAFADEISPDLEEQIGVLEGEGIRYLDLRSAWETNVLDLNDRQVAAIERALDAHGLRVAAIGSPVGKVSIEESLDRQMHRLERAIALAQQFGTRFIRIFSFYPPRVAAAEDAVAHNPAAYRDDVLARLRAMTERARAADVILLHENDRDLYGDTIARCVDLLQTINDPHFQAALDPANFIQCGQTPYPDGYEALQPWLRYVHVKDADAAGTVTAAGEGVARWPALLERLRHDGYDGFFSLEPHLAGAGRFAGFSGPDLFRHASRTFQRLLHEMGWYPEP